MGLKYQIAALTDVTENVRSLYKSEGNVFVLDAEGVVPTSRLDEFRNNNIDLNKRLEALKDVDPAKYRELMDLDKKVKEKELISKGDVDGVVALRVQAMKDELESKLTSATDDLTAAHGQIATLLIDNVVKSAALANGVLPTALDDMALRAKATFVVIKGVPTAKDAAGNVIYGKDGTTPLTPSEWVVNLRKTAPHLFAGFNGSNAGGGRGQGGTDTSKMTPAQKISLGISQGGLLGTLPAGQ